MGIASTIGLISGDTGVNAPSSSKVSKDYLGLLQGYRRGVQPLFDTFAKYAPQYAKTALSNFGDSIPTLTDIARSINPEQTDLLRSLTSRAQEGLDAGANLDPALAHIFEQSVRGGQASRGLGFGPSDVLQESSALTEFANSLRQQRQDFAGEVAGMNNQFDISPILSGAGALTAGAGSQLLSPGNSLNLLSLPYQGRLSAATSTAANKAGLYNTIDQSSSQLISSL